MEQMDTSALVEQCRAAIEGLERAQTAPPLMVLREADLVQRAVVDMRDALIERLRQEETATTARERAALDRINAALSLIVGLEYPIGGIPRESAKQARAVLNSVLEDGLLGKTERSGEEWIRSAERPPPGWFACRSRPTATSNSLL